MLSEDRIRKMIRLSDYEKGLGGVDLKRTHYWKMDYVRLQILKTFFAVLISVVLLAVLFVCYDPEYVMQHFLEFPYHKIVLYGGAGVAVAEIIAILVTVKRAGREYDESKSRVREYYVTLRELEELYEEEERQEEESS